MVAGIKKLKSFIKKHKPFRYIETVRVTKRRIAAILLAASAWLVGWQGLSVAATLVNEIRVQGNLRIEEDAIRLSIQAQEGQPFDQEVVDRDVKAIYRMGFFDDVTVEFSTDGVLTYTVAERPYIREVEVLGNDKVSTEDIEAALGMRPRTALDTSRLQAGLQRVLRLYSEAGHVNTRVDYTLTPEENNQTIITLEITEGETLLIKKITFEGNRAFDEDELKDVMQTKEDWIIPFTSRGRLDPDVLNNDVTLLSSFYYDHGYIDHRIDEPLVLTRGSGLEVVIRVEEGERYRVGVVKLGGDLEGKPERLLQRVTLTSGQIFRGSRMRRDITALQQRYADRGYAFADIAPLTRADPDKRLVDVTFMIKRGPLVYFDQVRITGNVKTRDNVIRRELEVAEKERYSSAKIIESRNALLRTGFFKDVKVETPKTDKEDHVRPRGQGGRGPHRNLQHRRGLQHGNLALVPYFARGKKPVRHRESGVREPGDQQDGSGHRSWPAGAPRPWAPARTWIWTCSTTPPSSVPGTASGRVSPPASACPSGTLRCLTWGGAWTASSRKSSRTSRSSRFSTISRAAWATPWPATRSPMS